MTMRQRVGRRVAHVAAVMGSLGLIIAFAPGAQAQGENAPARITGRVMADGQPASDTCVQWYTETERTTVRTGADGRFELSGLAPGRPGKLEACGSSGRHEDSWAASQAYSRIWFDGAVSRATAEFVTLEPGSTMHWEASLPRYNSGPSPRFTAWAIVVTSLVDPTGCLVRVTEVSGAQQVVELRPSTRSDVWFADVFGISGWPLMHLECDGRLVGRDNDATQFTPFVYPGTGAYDHFSPIAEIKYDIEGPVITPHGVPTAWTNEAVTVLFSCDDATDGKEACSHPQLFSEGDRRTITAIDELGNVSNLVVGPLKIDQTPPVIRVSTSRRRFTLGETLSLGCTVTDARSGLRSRTNTCPPDGTRAKALGAGTHTFRLAGTDVAGNASTRSVTVEIVK